MQRSAALLMLYKKADRTAIEKIPNYCWQKSDQRHWRYAQKPRDPLPYPEPAFTNIYTRRQMRWNPIPSKVGYIHRKLEWGYPKYSVPRRGIYNSASYFPFFFDKYFPDVEFLLSIDSVLNKKTREVVFYVPCEMSREEIANYLRNVHNVDNILRVTVMNIQGRRYKNELGAIKKTIDIKVAKVLLDEEVGVDVKTVRSNEDETPDVK
jgi:large subunit ribosomal protein L23